MGFQRLMLILSLLTGCARHSQDLRGAHSGRERTSLAFFIAFNCLQSIASGSAFGLRCDWHETIHGSRIHVSATFHCTKAPKLTSFAISV